MPLSRLCPDYDLPKVTPLKRSYLLPKSEHINRFDTEVRLFHNN